MEINVVIFISIINFERGSRSVKKLIIGIVFSSILLVGCNGETEDVVFDDSKNSESNDNLALDVISQLKNEIMASIIEQTELDRESIGAVMLDGNPFDEMTISASFPKDVKVDDTMIQQIIEDSIKTVSETENVAISEEGITIKIEKY